MPYDYTARTNKLLEIIKLIDNDLLSNDSYSNRSSRNLSDINLINEISYLDRLTAKLQIMSKPTADVLIDYLKHICESKPTVSENKL